MDSLEVDSKHPRGLKDINFALHRIRKAYIESTSDWLVKTDITRFYPSIYTHSIPWAAYGKERVKSDLKTHEGSLGDRLDAIVRACNRNQTVGIPIGPETSRILAEIISSRIDDMISTNSKDFTKNRVDRLQDDWFIGLSSFEKSENAIASISAAYRAYGLDINGSKTSIQRALLHTEEAWQSELGAFLIHRPGPLHGNRLREFLSLVIRLQVQFQQQPVTNYALSVIASHRPLPNDAEMLESFLLKAAVVSPGSMDRICQVLLNLSFKTKRVSSDRIEKRFNELITQNVVNGHDYEVIWLLFTLRGLKQTVTSRILYDSLVNTQSSALALTMLDMNSQGLCRRRLPISAWEACVTEDRVKTEPTWLMAYEGIRHGWLADPRSVMTKPFFQSMASRNVVFYDERRNVTKTEKTVKLRGIARKIDNLEISSLMFQLRHFDDNY
ncbi:RNA-directed DNA polymerase [Sandarakinorhabdus sp. DWP1-3-1]|uniref:RNA-directed DNA polymerase n=1 Tax=Sandarakinorhabdus sp. DWP1-3-1 TaxID=2804627 RepID=UPI003CED9B97